jgi:cullin-associated NEDD8-dissociated protein 1
LKETILQSFSSNSEEIKSSASYSLGSISIGNLEQYIPFILREIDMQPKRQYLLLHSLKEVIFICILLKYNFYFLMIIDIV